MANDERRRHPRVQLRCSGEWVAGADRLPCFTASISMVGASLEFGAEDEVTVGASGTLTLRLPDPYGAFELKGKLVWIGNSNGRPIAGLEFTDYKDDAEQLLDKI